MTRYWYEIYLSNGKQATDDFRYETDFIAPMPVGAVIYLREPFAHDENMAGLVVSKIYHELPLPHRTSEGSYVREGRVIMQLTNSKGDRYLQPSNYNRLVKFLKKQGWRSRREEAHRI